MMAAPEATRRMLRGAPIGAPRLAEWLRPQCCQLAGARARTRRLRNGAALDSCAGFRAGGATVAASKNGCETRFSESGSPANGSPGRRPFPFLTE
jgi:hypothetical protein